MKERHNQFLQPVGCHRWIILIIYKVSGNKAELIDPVLTNACGNLTARDAVEEEESPSSCKDNTSSESSDSDDSSNDSSTCIEESFVVMFVPEEEIQLSKLGMRESMGGDFFQGVGGLNIHYVRGKGSCRN